MKRQKTNLQRSARQKSKFPVKQVIVTAAVFLAVIFIFGFTRETLKNAGYFQVTDVITTEENGIDISYFKGRNILTLDLSQEAKRLSQLYPVYKKIRLVRIFPDRIYVDFIKRNTVAYVKLQKYFFVDENSVLFGIPEQEGKGRSLNYTLGDGLPVILGLERKITHPLMGTKYSYNELELALEIIKELKIKNILRDYQVKIIDVTNIVDASIVMNSFLASANPQDSEERGGFEIIVGQENIEYKIGLLANLLGQIDRKQDNIEYFDLRFKEPVIKLKNK